MLSTLLAAFGLSGCGGGADDSSAADGPIEGRPVSKANELVGTWMRVSSGDLLGLEFLEDGKALVTSDMGDTVTLGYSLLDGGRLNLIGLGGASTVFETRRAGDVLELTPEMAMQDEGQRFRRVPEGTTLAAALRQHAEQIAAEQQRRREGLEQMLAAGDLVIVGAENGPAAVLSLALDHVVPQIGGSAVMDDDPERDDPLRPVRAHPLAGTIAPLDDVTNRLQVTLDVQPAVEPSGQQDIRGRITLVADGPLDRSRLTGTATFPGTQANGPVVLESDARRHGQTLARLEEQREARARALAKVSDPLGGRVILTGRKTGLGGADPQPVELTLERQADRYTGTATVASRQLTGVTGGLDLVIGQGALYVMLPTGEQWRLQPDEDGRVFSGPWRPHARADFLGHGEVRLTIERAWTEAQVAAEREAIERFLGEELQKPTRFVGFVRSQVGSNPVQYWPVSLELSIGAGGSAAGQAWLPGQNVGLQLSGHRAGNSIALSSTGVLEGSTNDRGLMQQRWQLAVAGMDPEPRLAGNLSSPLGAGGALTLAPMPADGAAARQRLLDALRAAPFLAINTRISRNPEPAYFRFQVESGGKIAGDVVGGDLTGSRPSALPPGLIAGELVEDRGFTLMKVTISGSHNPERGREGVPFDYTFAGVPDDEHGLILTGWDKPNPGFQTWMTLTPAPDASITLIEEQRIRLAAQRLGAALQPPKQPKPGEKALVVVHATERDKRVGQIFHADGRYSHGNTLATAALHAGAMQPDEIAVLRLTYHAPFTSPTTQVERNGVTSARSNFRENNTVPSFSIERVNLD
ncbi:MAG TPA: hypothetical protein VF210_16105 [Pseudomonadales bacterium]